MRWDCFDAFRGQEQSLRPNCVKEKEYIKK